jgi:predicted nuclease of restriction endonuclease-like RecB superfamily
MWKMSEAVSDALKSKLEEIDEAIFKLLEIRQFVVEFPELAPHVMEVGGIWRLNGFVAKSNENATDAELVEMENENV